MNSITFESFRETDIRPDNLMQQAMKLLEEDTRRLIAKKAAFVRVPCPTCGSENTSKIYEKRGLNFEICKDCETVFGNPRPTTAMLEQYYNEAKYYEYWNKYIYPQTEQIRRVKIVCPRAERITAICQRFNIPLNTLIEVGAGFGLFSEELQKQGTFKEIIVIEPTPSLADSCRRRGLKVIESPVEKVKLKQKTVNVVASFEVIEHLFCPREFITSCASLLSPGGLLVISCPNIKGFDLIVLKEVADTITPEHLNYFHPESIKQLVRQCDFEVLEVSTPGQLDAEIVRKKTLSGEFCLSHSPFLQQILISEWDHVGASFQQFLVDNQLSSHMWLVAKKQ